MRGIDRAGRGFTVLGAHASGDVLATLGEPGFSSVPMRAEMMRLCVPDVADPATVGCLLALAREAWGDPTITTHCWRLSPAAIARKPGRGPEQWSAAGAPVKALILDEQAATDWRTAPGWDDSPRGPYGALCPSFRASSEAESLIAAILAAPLPSREASGV